MVLHDGVKHCIQKWLVTGQMNPKLTLVLSSNNFDEIYTVGVDPTVVTDTTH